MATKNSHCSYCGVAFAVDAPWPRPCTACGNTTYRNPLPVAVLLAAFGDSLLLVERADRTGYFALPGGYINDGESWQEAAVREVREETGMTADPAQVMLYDVQSAPDGTVLIFGLVSLSSEMPLPTAPPQEAAAEVLGISTARYDALAKQSIPFAFPLHEKVAAHWGDQILRKRSPVQRRS